MTEPQEQRPPTKYVRFIEPTADVRNPFVTESSEQLRKILKSHREAGYHVDQVTSTVVGDKLVIGLLFRLVTPSAPVVAVTEEQAAVMLSEFTRAYPNLVSRLLEIKEGTGG